MVLGKITFEEVKLPGHEGRKGYFMHTFQGKRYFPCDPRPEEVDIVDIAHGLSNQCRFNGQTLKYLSTAEHSVLVSQFHSEEDPFEKLMHDAAEAYIGDIIRPIKYLKGFGDTYKKILEEMNERVIAEKFGLVYPWPKSVKVADEAVCSLEMRDNIRAEMKGHLHDASVVPEFELKFWPPEQAKGAFLYRFFQLMRQRAFAI